MTQKPFNTETTDIVRINLHSLLVLIGGQGIFEIDFSRYYFVSGEIIPLAPGQYVRVISGDLNITQFEFSDIEVSQYTNSRFLFVHLISAAHVELSQSKILATNCSVLLDALVHAWQELNPFMASTEEVNLLFSVKEIIDEQFREPVSVVSIANILNERPTRINTIFKDKIGNTVNQLHQKKILLESKRQVIFTESTTKEISYDLGFKDPAYFNRFFKLHTGQTPYEFRGQYPVTHNDPIIGDLLALIDRHATELRPASFYAESLRLTTSILARRVQQSAGTTLRQLIQNKRANQAKAMLSSGLSVSAVAFELGFSEPNHFSAFFKNTTGQTPSDFRAGQQKVQSFVKTA